MTRIIFLNRFFFPDHSATSQILSDLAFQLAALGYDIHVLTSRQIYDDPTVSLRAEEIADAVQIHRISTTHFGRSNLATRGLDYLTFYVSLAARLSSLARAGDIVVAKTDPPLLSVLAASFAGRRSFRLVNWLQDIYPEIAAELKVPLLSGQLGRAIAPLRDRSLRAADANVVLGTSMAERLFALGVARQRVRIIPNWTDDESIRPLHASENPLRKEWDLVGKFVVGYSGNLGRAHEFETLLTAAGRLRDDPRITFLVIGGGQQFDALKQHATALGLAHSFRFLPYQPRDMLRYSLSLPDVHWVSMRPELEGLIFPSKLYGIAAAGRPILALTGSNGEIARLVREFNCGAAVEPGDAGGLADAILRLVNDPAECRQMGDRSRAMLDQSFTRKEALRRWLNVIEAVERPHAQPED